MRELSEQEVVRREKLENIKNPYPERNPAGRAVDFYSRPAFVRHMWAGFFRQRPRGGSRGRAQKDAGKTRRGFARLLYVPGTKIRDGRWGYAGADCGKDGRNPGGAGENHPAAGGEAVSGVLKRPGVRSGFPGRGFYCLPAFVQGL